MGRLVVAFGRLEYLIKLCVKDVTRRGFTRGMIEAKSERQFNKLCERAKKLAIKHLTHDAANQFCQVIDYVRKLANERNDAVHALWTTDDKGKPLRIRPQWNKSTKTVDWENRVVELAELQTLRQQMEEIYSKLDSERKRWSKDQQEV
jgi:hypothetical protein